MCHINGVTLDDEAQAPFGGLNDSCYGRSCGRTGLAELLACVLQAAEPS